MKINANDNNYRQFIAKINIKMVNLNPKSLDRYWFSIEIHSAKIKKNDPYLKITQSLGNSAHFLLHETNMQTAYLQSKKHNTYPSQILLSMKIQRQIHKTQD